MKYAILYYVVFLLDVAIGAFVAGYGSKVHDGPLVMVGLGICLSSVLSYIQNVLCSAKCE